MGIIQFILLAAFLGILAYLLVTYVKMPPIVAKIIVGAVVIVLIVLLLQAMGLWPGDVQIPRVN